MAPREDQRASGAPPSGVSVNPWEERLDRGRASAYVACLVLLATSPRRFFKGVRPGAGIWGPLAFLGTTFVLSTILDGGIPYVLGFVLPDPAVEFMYGYRVPILSAAWPGSAYMQSLAPPLGPLLRGLGLFNLLVVVTLLGSFIFVPVILLYTALAHLFLVVTRGSRPHGFRGTWAAGCYASGAAFLVVIPVAGYYLAVLGVGTAAGLGLHVVQRTGVVRAAGFALLVVLLVSYFLLIGP